MGEGSKMQDTQVKEEAQSQSTDTPVHQTTLKSRFDDAEYERWCEKLRNAASKNK
jgi:hypothetical protein